MAQKNNLTIQVVSIIGGILTAIFFLGFLVVASIIRTETSSLIIGCLFIITTLTISRRLTVPFLDAMNITLYIAGCALIAYGPSRSTSITAVIIPATLERFCLFRRCCFSHLDSNCIFSSFPRMLYGF